MTQAKKRRIVTIEYDVTGLTPEQVDALLLDALVRCRDVSFKVQCTPVSDPGSANTPLTPC